MNARPRPRSLGELIARTRVPDKSVGIFWPGGASLVFKSALQRVYLIDPSQESWSGASRLGAIDIRPDLVFCSLVNPGGVDVSTLTHLAKAFPETRFAGSAEGRDHMIGRSGADAGDVPVDPGRVHALEHDMQLDVRQVGVSDRVRIRVLNAADRPWNVLFSFSSVQVCLVRLLRDAADIDALVQTLRRRIDVLLCAIDCEAVALAGDLLDAVRPGYAIPLGYDRMPGGRDLARSFRDQAGRSPGVKSYLFAEDYMEGLLYSRIMSRLRSN